MATVSEVNICRVRGDTDSFTVTVQDANGAAIDITGFSFLFTVDPSDEPVNSANNLFQLSSPAGGIVLTTPASGLITLTLSGAQADQTPGVYFYDLQMTDTGGAIKTILKGQYEVVQDITK